MSFSSPIARASMSSMPASVSPLISGMVRGLHANTPMYRVTNNGFQWTVPRQDTGNIRSARQGFDWLDARTHHNQAISRLNAIVRGDSTGLERFYFGEIENIPSQTTRFCRTSTNDGILTGIEILENSARIFATNRVNDLLEMTTTIHGISWKLVLGTNVNEVHISAERSLIRQTWAQGGGVIESRLYRPLGYFLELTSDSARNTMRDSADTFLSNI